MFNSVRGKLEVAMENLVDPSNFLFRQKDVDFSFHYSVLCKYTHFIFLRIGFFFVFHSSSCSVLGILWTFPDYNCNVSTKKHVQQSFTFKCNFKTVALAHYYLPRRTTFFIHHLLDHFSCCLKNKQIIFYEEDTEDSYLGILMYYSHKILWMSQLSLLWSLVLPLDEKHGQTALSDQF